jgi:hypothetical protein
MSLSASDIANYATIASVPLTLLTWFFTREHLAKFWRRRWKLIGSLVAGVACIGLLILIGWRSRCPFRFG